MNGDGVHGLSAGLRTVSGQRWALAGIALAAALGATVIAGIATGSLTYGVVVLVAAIAVTAVAVPDSLAGTAVLGVVLLQWIVVNDEPTTWWAIPVAVCLLVFHQLVALSATAPPSATVDAAILGRWSRRAVLVVAVTVVVWGLVVVTDGRAGHLGTAAVLAGLGAVAVAALLTGARERGDPGRSSS